MEMTLTRGTMVTAHSPGVEAIADAGEEYLVRLAATGDEQAYSKLVSAYRARLYNFVRTVVGNPEAAEDITQEAFVKAFFNLSKLKEPGRFKSWLFRIANNSALDLLRRKKLPQADVDDSVHESYVDERNPEAGVVTRERTAHIRAALGKLKEDQRSILVMCDLQGLSYQEIAEVLRIPFGTVQSRIFYARKKLREHLDPSIVFGGEA